MDSKSLGKKLRAHRARCGWNIEKCSEMIGISTKYLSNIERGDKVPKLETFIKILNTLNASADDMLQDSLTVGYEAKSNDIIRKLNALDVSKRKQALDILDSVIMSMKEN